MHAQFPLRNRHDLVCQARWKMCFYIQILRVLRKQLYLCFFNHIRVKKSVAVVYTSVPFLFSPEQNKALLTESVVLPESTVGDYAYYLFFHIFFLFAKFQCTPFHSSFAQIQTFHIKTCPFLRYKGFVYMLSSCYLIINHFQESFVFYH